MNSFLSIGKICFAVLLLFSTLSAIELGWKHDYKKALTTAKKEYKMVYLFIGADHCKYCESFKKQTLSDKKLIEAMKKKYVLLYMSRET